MIFFPVLLPNFTNFLKKNFLLLLLLLVSVNLKAQNVLKYLQHGTKIIETDGQSNNFFGVSIAMSGDGKTALIGARFANLNNGWVYVYTLENNKWVQQSKLVGSGNIGAAMQGYSAALSYDGNTAVIGGTDDNSINGAVWAFTRTNGTWKQQGNKLVINDDRYAGMGTSLSISSDGNTLIVGGTNFNSNQGAAWIFTRQGETWKRQGAKLMDPNSLGGTFQGISVSISGDGNTAIIGGYKDAGGIGAAWVYLRTDTVWKQQGPKLSGNDMIGLANFGVSVDLSYDGNVASIGAYTDNNKVGAVYIFNRTNGNWIQQGSKIVPNDYIGQATLGITTTLSAKGDILFIGSNRDNNNLGASWIFVNNDNKWVQQGSKLIGSDKIPETYQGNVMACSDDGNITITGGCVDNFKAGAAWFFQRQPVLKFISSPITLLPTTNYEIIYSINNPEITSSPSVNFSFYLSKDLVYDATDILVSREFAIPQIKGNTNISGKAILTTPSSLNGANYALAVMDINNNDLKYDATNLIGSISLVNQPDLKISTINITETVSSDVINIDVSISNLGTASTEKKCILAYYLSLDEILDSSDFHIGYNEIDIIGSEKTFIAPVNKYKLNEINDFFVLVSADYNNLIAESNESNNVSSKKYKKSGQVDLQPSTPILNKLNLIPGEIGTINSKINNIGNLASGTFNIQYYLSKDQTIDNLDLKIIQPSNIPNIDAGLFYNSPVQNFQIPETTTPGDYFIICSADDSKIIPESVETNNISYLAVSIATPADLIISNLTIGRSNFLPGDTSNVYYAVKNEGGNIASAFYVNFFISSNEILDPSDNSVLSPNFVESLGAGESTKNAHQILKFDKNMAQGNYYLFCVVDKNNSLSEQNESNNVSFVKISVSSLPDLSIKANDISSSNIVPGDILKFSFNVLNSGNTKASNIKLQFFISSDQTYDASDVEILNTISIPEINAVSNLNTNELSYQIPQNTIQGLYYLLCVADINNTIIETNELNNTSDTLYKVGAFSDIQIKNQSALTSKLIAGDSINLSFTVLNNGSNPINDSFKINYFFSSDKVVDAEDLLLNGYNIIDKLGPNTPIDFPKYKLLIPGSTKPGVYNLLIQADSENKINELSKTNNSANIPIEIYSLPDFVIRNVKIDKNIALSNDSIFIQFFFNNLGGKSLNTRIEINYYISKDSILDNLDSPIKQTFLEKSMDLSSSFKIENEKLIIPSNLSGGNYYVFVIADERNLERELLESNNINKIGITIGDASDLSIENFLINPSRVFHGDTIKINSSVFNRGTNTKAEFKVRYYYSKDAILDSLDIPIKSIVNVKVLNAMEKIALPTQNLVIEKAIQFGLNYIIIYCDFDSQISESNELNNISPIPFVITSNKIEDIAIFNPGISQTSAKSGDTLTIDCGFVNNGKEKFSVTSNFQCFLSADKLFDITDIPLHNPVEISSLEAKGFNIIRNTAIKIPDQQKSGKYYVLFVADKDNVLSETNEVNNIVAFVLRILDRADLTISNFNSTQANLFPGDSTLLACTISNVGNGESQVNVNLQYYLSKDKIFDSDDILLNKGITISNITGNNKFIVNATLNTIPPTPPGQYYLLAFIDNIKLLQEINESDNIVSLPITIKALPDLRISNGRANPTKVMAGDTVNIIATIQNNGLGDVENSFKYKYYLSKNKSLDSSDNSISDLLTSSALKGSQSRSINLNYIFSKTLSHGIYYILIQTDASKQIREVDENNNIGFIPIQLGNIDNLDLSVFIFTNKTVYLPGDTVSFDMIFKNEGEIAVTATKFQFFLSIDDNYDNSDFTLTNFLTLGNIAIDSSKKSSSYVIIPPKIDPRFYNVICIADVLNSLNEINEENNQSAFSIRVSPLPDLKISKTSSKNQSVFLGDTISVNTSIIYEGGNNTLKDVALQYYFSKDQLFDNSDIALGKAIFFSTLELSKSEVAVPPTLLKIPEGLKSGNYYLLPLIDHQQKIIESNEVNNYRPYFLTIKTRPLIIENKQLTDPVNFTDVLIKDFTIQSEFPIANVTFSYRLLTDSTKIFFEELSSEKNFRGILAKNKFDEIGIEYTFIATDSNGTKSNSNKGIIPVHWAENKLKIPYKSVGKEAGNYRIITFPLQMKNSSIDSIINKNNKKYDKSNWRILHYSGKILTEIGNGLVNFEPGIGYWFIAKDSTEYNLFNKAGTTMARNYNEPFQIKLTQGWNQIGNPYNMDIYWDDIKNYKKNDKAALETWKKWEGEWNSDDIIRKMEGGFVYANTNTTLYFPTQKRNAISKNLRNGKDDLSIDSENWQLPFSLETGEQKYTLGCIGVNKNASLKKDKFDDITPPRFINYLELYFDHPEHSYTKFSKDIIPDISDYVWELTIEAEKNGTKFLRWDNNLLRSNLKNLILFDKETGSVIDMKKKNNYIFEQLGTKKLKVYYGTNSFIDSSMVAENITVTNAHPNPFTDITTISVGLPPSNFEYEIQLDIYNSVGIKITTIAQKTFESGFYDFEWNGCNETGEKQFPGVYYYKVAIKNANITKQLRGKVILNK